MAAAVPRQTHPSSAATLAGPLRGQYTALLALILLGFGIFLGSAAGPQSADTYAASVPGRLDLRLPPTAGPSPSASLAQPPSAPASTPTPASTTPSSGASASTANATSAAPSGSSAGPLAGSTGATTPLPLAASTPTSSAPTASAPLADPPPPPVHHVFLISLADQGYAGAFASPATAPYLDGTLLKQGTMLPNFYAIAHGSLADDIALISGQGPNPDTQADCPSYTDLAPGTDARSGQFAGHGCVYPARARTLADQLTAGKRTWRAYLEDSGSGGPGAPAVCRHPTLGASDPTQQPRPTDAYATWRNPFVYFHSITDGPSCAQHDVGLEQLPAALAQGKLAPSLNYIVPNVCHDGSASCAAPGPSGMAAADAFLKTWVPAILASPAYRDAGALLIAPDQAPSAGTGADSSACCDTPAFPFTPNAGGSQTPGQGGGQVGLLILSPLVRSGVVDPHAYNVFSLLRTLENIFRRTHLGYAARADVQPFGSDVWSSSRAGQHRHRSHGTSP